MTNGTTSQQYYWYPSEQAIQALSALGQKPSKKASDNSLLREIRADTCVQTRKGPN